MCACACTNYAMHACYINTLTDEQHNGTRIRALSVTQTFTDKRLLHLYCYFCPDISSELVKMLCLDEQ